MTESELIKVEQLLDVVFDSKKKKVVLTDSGHNSNSQGPGTQMKLLMKSRINLIKTTGETYQI